MITSYNLIYDPQRQGYDTTNFWKTITGTPAISGGILRFTSAEAVSLQDIVNGTLSIKVKIPTAPTSGDSRKFGFNSVAKGSYIYFQIAGTAFTLETSDGNGNTSSTVIPWQSTWTNTSVVFTINWTAGGASIYANGVKLNYRIQNETIQQQPLSIYVKNGNADNMDVSYIECDNIQKYTNIKS